MRLLWSIMTTFHCTNAALAVELTKQMQVQNLIHDLSTKAAPNQHPQIRRETFFKRPFMLSLAYITSDRHSTYVASGGHKHSRRYRTLPPPCTRRTPIDSP